MLNTISHENYKLKTQCNNHCTTKIFKNNSSKHWGSEQMWLSDIVGANTKSYFFNKLKHTLTIYPATPFPGVYSEK